MKFGTKLANLMKERENPEFFESQIGKVISPPPNLRISIYNEKVILEPHQLYMNDRLFDDYTREYKLTGTIDSITLDTCDITTTSSNGPAGEGPHTHKHGDISGKLTGKGEYETHGTIVNTCTLIVGDVVKLTPAERGQIWFVDYKVRKIEGGKRNVSKNSENFLLGTE